MVVSPFIPCPLEIRSTGIGLLENVDVILTDPANDIISRHYHPQIVNPEDIEKIEMPVVTCDWEATEEKYERMMAIFGDIIQRIIKRRETWDLVRPWDELVSWWGVEALMVSLTQRPEMVNAAI